MKVKEILEILQVPEEELLTKLDNVGINADLETEIAPDIIKKLSKVYKVEIKATKAKKAAPKKAKAAETKEETEKKPEPKTTTKKKETKAEPKAKPKQTEAKEKKQAKPKTEKKAAAKPKAEVKAKRRLNLKKKRLKSNFAMFMMTTITNLKKKLKFIQDSKMLRKSKM